MNQGRFAIARRYYPNFEDRIINDLNHEVKRNQILQVNITILIFRIEKYSEMRRLWSRLNIEKKFQSHFKIDMFKCDNY